MESLGDVLKRAQLVRRPGPGIEAEPERPVCPACHGAGYLRYDVPPEDQRFGQLVPCECTRRDLEARRIRRLVERSNLGALQHLTFDSFVTSKYVGSDPPRDSPEDAFRHARAYAEKPDGWLVLYGDFGTGKTHLAVAIANYRLARAEPAVFIVVPELLDHLRSTFSPSSDVTYDELFETVRSTPLLILDDLGAQTTTPWAQEKLYQILNYRSNRRLPTVITTNLGPTEIEPRLQSRIFDMHISTRCEVRGRDARLGRTHQAGAGPSPRRRAGRTREELRP